MGIFKANESWFMTGLDGIYIIAVIALAVVVVSLFKDRRERRRARKH